MRGRDSALSACPSRSLAVRQAVFWTRALRNEHHGHATDVRSSHLISARGTGEILRALHGARGSCKLTVQENFENQPKWRRRMKRLKKLRKVGRPCRRHLFRRVRRAVRASCLSKSHFLSAGTCSGHCISALLPRRGLESVQRGTLAVEALAASARWEYTPRERQCGNDALRLTPCAGPTGDCHRPPQHAHTRQYMQTISSLLQARCSQHVCAQSLSSSFSRGCRQT